MGVLYQRKSRRKYHYAADEQERAQSGTALNAGPPMYNYITRRSFAPLDTTNHKTPMEEGVLSIL